jgi:peptidoglycan/xylan/chitin deacetylase (PgdA/CDA1 family)
VENALPELHLRGIPCTIFVPTGSLGCQPSWIDPLHQDAKEVVTSAETVRVLGGKPLVRIGSHSVSHPDFRRLDDGQARDELASSKAALEELVGREVTSFSFPYGAFTRRDLDLAEQCGYKRVFTTDHAQVANPRNAFAVGRVRVGPDDWPLEFRLKVGGAYRWLAPAAAAKRSLLSALRRGRVQRRQPPEDP